MAADLDAECADCEAQAAKIRCLLQDMWNGDKGYMEADINNDYGRSNKGTNTFIASIHS